MSPFLVLVGSFFTKDGFCTFIPACCFPSLSPSLPSDKAALPGLRLASLHPIRIACRACDVTYMFDLSYAWTDMWTGCGGSVKRASNQSEGGGQPRHRGYSVLRHKAEIKWCQWEGQSLLAPTRKKVSKAGCVQHEYLKSCIRNAALPSLPSLLTTHLTPPPPSKTTTFSIILFNVAPRAFG